MYGTPSEMDISALREEASHFIVSPISTLSTIKTIKEIVDILLTRKIWEYCERKLVDNHY